MANYLTAIDQTFLTNKIGLFMEENAMNNQEKNTVNQETIDDKNLNDESLEINETSDKATYSTAENETLIGSTENMEKENQLTSEPEDTTSKLQEQLATMNDKYIRLVAEFDNYRKRTLKERIDLTKTASEEILKKILPLIDNFERALKSVQEAKDLDAVKIGIELIYTNFKEFLKQNAVKEIDCLEKDFNTDLHEAITTIPAPNKKLKGKVVDVIEKGYMLQDKVIRFAKVVIGD